MSRYRPPRPAGTPLITPEGEARLRAELHELWHVRRPQVTQSVSEAAAQGDRSENAEYTYGKKMLREIDSRVRFLTKRLEKLKVVSEKPSDPNKVYFGAWVTIEDEDGEQSRYRIVGPDELDLKQGPVSYTHLDVYKRQGIKGPGGTRHLGLRDRSATLAERLQAEKPLPVQFSRSKAVFTARV